MVDSMELEYRDGEGATAPENFGIILSYYMIGSIFYARRMNKGCYEHVMCKMLLFWAKTGKHLRTFLVLT